MRSLAKTFAISLFICGFSLPAVRAEDAPKEPSVSALKRLLGHKIDDETVQNLVEEQRLGKFAKGDSGGYSRNNDETGTFALLFRSNIICRAIIYLVPIKGVASPYRGALPFEVQISDSPAGIRKRLGIAQHDGIRKDGSGWLIYKRDAIRATFAFANNKMYEIYLDKADKK